MIRVPFSVLKRGGWAVALLAAALATADEASAQAQMRGPPGYSRPSTLTVIPKSAITPGQTVTAITRYVTNLLPQEPIIPLLNNGSLQISAGPPSASAPNSLPFVYIAALPLGDRLQAQGVMYDTDLIPNLNGGGANGMGNNGNGNGNNNGVNGNKFARQRMMARNFSSPMMGAGYGMPMMPAMGAGYGMPMMPAMGAGYGMPMMPPSAMYGMPMMPPPAAFNPAAAPALATNTSSYGSVPPTTTAALTTSVNAYGALPAPKNNADNGDKDKADKDKADKDKADKDKADKDKKDKADKKSDKAPAAGAAN